MAATSKNRKKGKMSAASLLSSVMQDANIATAENVVTNNVPLKKEQANEEKKKAFEAQYIDLENLNKRDVTNTTEEIKGSSENDNSKDASKKISDSRQIEYIDINKMQDAPAEWNEYPRLKVTEPDKYLELKMSINENGINEPLILWEQKDQPYMILAGHNRRDISKEIIDERIMDDDFNEQKYRFVPCIVYKTDELTEEKARELVDDSNIYRDISTLAPKYKIMIARKKMEYYKTRRYQGARIDKIAESMGIKKTAVYDYLAIADKLIPEFQNYYYDQNISKIVAVKLTSFEKEIQQWLYEQYRDILKDHNVKKLQKDMSKEDIEKILLRTDTKHKLIRYSVPIDKENEFREMVAQWWKENINE